MEVNTHFNLLQAQISQRQKLQQIIGNLFFLFLIVNLAFLAKENIQARDFKIKENLKILNVINIETIKEDIKIITQAKRQNSKILFLFNKIINALPRQSYLTYFSMNKALKIKGQSLTTQDVLVSARALENIKGVNNVQVAINNETNTKVAFNLNAILS